MTFTGGCSDGESEDLMCV